MKHLPGGKFYYIVDHPGGRSAMGEDPLYDTGSINPNLYFTQIESTIQIAFLYIRLGYNAGPIYVIRIYI